MPQDIQFERNSIGFISLNEEQYRVLCETCDSALLAPDSAVERAAISWLHVVNEHPVSLAKYRGVFDNCPPDTLIAIKSAASTALRAKKTIRSLSGWHASSNISETTDVLFVSHILNEGQLGAKEDFYFGSLPETAMDLGLSCAVVLHDHTGSDLQTIAEKWPAKSAPRIIFDSTLPWREEWSIRRRLKCQSGQLASLANKSETTLQRLILQHASRQAMSSTSIATLRFYEQLTRLAQRLRPKAIVVTYEGHAWERLAFAAARKAAPNVRCIGYQHTILFPRQHAIKRRLGAFFDPNVVLTAGKVARDILREASQLDSVQIEVVGTHRFETPRYGLFERILRKESLSCLVIPDGTLSECLIIFDFVVDAAILAPALHFVIRMHPVLDFDAVAAANPRLKTLPANVEISTSPISADFERCRWALYRGSSAAIHAVIAGLRPFYISCPNELRIDPLYQLSEWRKIVASPSEFVEKAQLDLDSAPDVLSAEWTGAREYCQRYFQQVDVNSFCRNIVRA
jgi:hypothetical protein